jgi:hypothetical protein
MRRRPPFLPSFCLSAALAACAGGGTADDSSGAPDASIQHPADAPEADAPSPETDAPVGGADASATDAATTDAVAADAATGGGTIVISEIRSRGAAGAGDEFVELYNPGAAPVTLDSAWTLEARSNTAGTYLSRWAGTGKTIPAHGHFLIASAGYTQAPAADEALSTGITDASSLRLQHGGVTVDAVCYAFDAASAMPFTTDATYTCEGAPVATNPHNNGTTTNTDASLERKPGGASGNGQDTNDTSADFAVLMPAAPQSSQSAPTP